MTIDEIKEEAAKMGLGAAAQDLIDAAYDAGKRDSMNMTFPQFAAFVRTARFRWAKTYANSPWPHYYTLMRDARSRGEFTRAACYIASQGEQRSFGKETYRYVEVDDQKYWIMEKDPLLTTLINQAPIVGKAHPPDDEQP